jgi:hypothetical protein
VRGQNKEVQTAMKEEVARTETEAHQVATAVAVTTSTKNRGIFGRKERA